MGVGWVSVIYWDFRPTCDMSDVYRAFRPTASDGCRMVGWYVGLVSDVYLGFRPTVSDGVGRLFGFVSDMRPTLLECSPLYQRWRCMGYIVIHSMSKQYLVPRGYLKCFDEIRWWSCMGRGEGG